MPYKFTCMFTGLCGFVFNKPFAQTPERARVLLPEGDESAIRESLVTHRSILLIPKANLKSIDGIKPPQPYILQAKGRVAMLVFFLTDQEMSFDFSGEGEPKALEVNSCPIANPENPVGNEKNSLLTIARLEKGAPGASALADGCLADPPDVERVDARVLISGGSLYVRSLTEINGTPDVWDFKVPNGEGIPPLFSQVLAEEVVLERRKMESNVVLLGTSLSDGSDAFRLEVGPDDTESEVEITVLCGEAEGLLDQKPFRDENERDLAKDIRLLYRLSTVFDADAFDSFGIQPIPQRRRGGFGLSIHCPRTLFVAHPDA